VNRAPGFYLHYVEVADQDPASGSPLAGFPVVDLFKYGMMAFKYGMAPHDKVMSRILVIRYKLEYDDDVV